MHVRSVSPPRKCFSTTSRYRQKHAGKYGKGSTGRTPLRRAHHHGEEVSRELDERDEEELEVEVAAERVQRERDAIIGEADDAPARHHDALAAAELTHAERVPKRALRARRWHQERLRRHERSVARRHLREYRAALAATALYVRTD